ncbi:MAG: hypothetical protein HY873_13165 [Chloroflexi bacterium]|nr:hypothetical protein [Chloroflexota bacterium]
MTVLDVSNYDLTTFDAECMKSAGVTAVIIGCQDEDAADVMANRCEAAGLPIIGVYAFLYFGLDTLGQTGAAIRVALRHSVGRVWLDCESTGEYDAASGPMQRQDELAACCDAVRAAGLSPGIYTGGWWWPGNMASEAFSHLPLWHSEYPNDGHAVPEVAYGGWSKVAIHQYTSQFWCCGRNRDANYVFEEDEMTREQLLEILEELGVAGPGIPTVKRLDEFVTAAFTAAQQTRTVRGLKKALHPDGPQT